MGRSIPFHVRWVFRFAIVGLTAVDVACAAHSASPPPRSELTSSPVHDRVSAERWVRAAIDAMGGEGALRGVRTVRLEGIGHRNMIEESERPEGPWVVAYSIFDETRDYEKGSLQRNSDTHAGIQSYKESVVFASGAVAKDVNGKLGPGRGGDQEEIELRLALGPDRALLNALAAPDLNDGDDLELQGVPHHLVHFTWRNTPVRIYFNRDTALPTAAETMTHPIDVFWGVWGDVTTRFLFSSWNVYRGPIVYPTQWDTERNGLPWRSETFAHIAFNPAVAVDTLSIPTEVVNAYRAKPKGIDDLLLSPPSAARVLADGIVQAPGAWNVAFVGQRDGLVIIEAPISSHYSAQVLAEARLRFPDLPVKAVISTSDAWPHIGGLREYAARGIPIYLLDRNRPLVERLLAAPHHLSPDAWAKSPRPPNLHIVSHRETIGDGPNRLDLYPAHTESGERMIMIHLPEHRFLYTSDLVQRMRDGSFYFPGYVLEATQIVAREKLSVERIFGMHLEPTPWSAVVQAADEAKRPEAKGR